MAKNSPKKPVVAAKQRTRKRMQKKPGPSRKPKMVSGGNPQVAKADGNAPVRAYIAAMPAWKRSIGQQLDAEISRAVPKVRKAVKWNSPFYGAENGGWFLAFHCFTRFVKVTFFQGTSLTPAPSGGKAKEARWIDIHQGEDATIHSAQFKSWIRQASRLPGWQIG